MVGMVQLHCKPLRIVKAVEQGTSKSATARLFDVSLSSVKRYVRRASRGESLAPGKGGGRLPKADRTTQKLLEEDVKKRPAATVSERRRFLESSSPARHWVTPPSGGFSSDSASAKKRSVGAVERDEFLRGAWREMVSGKVEPKRFVFVDEMGTNTSLSPL
jgi:transposase-like protein